MTFMSRTACTVVMLSLSLCVGCSTGDSNGGSVDEQAPMPDDGLPTTPTTPDTTDPDPEGTTTDPVDVDPSDPEPEVPVQLPDSGGGGTDDSAGNGEDPVSTEPGSVIFSESFDDIADWTSADTNVPEGWFSFRQTDFWAPSTGHVLNHEGLEILSSNADKARGETGKSAVFWRESLDGSYLSDKILALRLDEVHSSLYIEFYLRFDPRWTPLGSSKVFRVYAWEPDVEGERPFGFFPRGDAGPMMLWKYVHNQYGARNFFGLRGGPYGENYYMESVAGFPRALREGDASLNFTDDVRGQGPGGSNPEIEDKLYGGLISDQPNQTVQHTQIYGDPADGPWTKLAFYVQLNSAPGVADGVLTQWLNDEQLLHNERVPWVGPTSTDLSTLGWEIIAIGGNDTFPVFPESERHEEWYAIDDLLILDRPPQYLQGQ